MDHAELGQRFSALTTAHVADACIRAQVEVRCAPSALQAAVPGSHIAGRVCPTRHAGSVDIFLEAFESATAGDVLVVDNGGRLDEACVGDLVALEAQTAGLEGMVIWGLHRDTADIQRDRLAGVQPGVTARPARNDSMHATRGVDVCNGRRMDRRLATTSCSAMRTGCCLFWPHGAGEILDARRNDSRYRATSGGPHSERRPAAGAGAFCNLSGRPQGDAVTDVSRSLAKRRRSHRGLTRPRQLPPVRRWVRRPYRR